VLAPTSPVQGLATPETQPITGRRTRMNARIPTLAKNGTGNFIVVGKSRNVVVAVLQSIHSFANATCMVIGDFETTGLKWSTLCKRQITLTMHPADDDLFVRHVNALADSMADAVLIPADCEGVRLTNRVRARLNVFVTPIPDADMLERFDNKWRFHKLCASNAIPVPDTLLFGSKRDLDFDALAAELGLPFVVKPTNMAGSLGVQIIRNQAHFNAIIRDNGAYNFAPLIAQRYVDGEDIDISLLSLHGEISAFAIQQVQGSEIRFMQNTELAKVAADICRASRYHGVMHIDARIEKGSGKIYLIESNPRFWVSVIASVWCGLNFVAESVAQFSRAGGVLQLTSGTAYSRVPLLRPACWPLLVSEAGARGRLLRCMTFDLYTLFDLGRDLPVVLGRFVIRRATLGVGRVGRGVAALTGGYRRSP
jgi:predicted ATP-grasp superfamily ATP-dependent carboligase